MRDIGEIIIVNDLENEIRNLRAKYNNTRVFPMNEDALKKGDFKIEHAREAIDESYISSNEIKIIILVGDKFNIYAQNALLKVLEEPPKNIKFILVTKYKSSILPTIISRMIIINKKVKTEIAKFEIDLNKINLGVISEFLANLSSQLKRDELRSKITSLLFATKEANLKLNRRELDCFSKAMFEVDSYEQPKYIFLKLLLMILEHKKRNFNKR
ncbi:DNA polymerase III subunit delta' [Helicobacter sp. MIT 14-3879]|uniref:DNA polymerase III subunit delta' n=1 Tax=Helicobacter sp. MIT 14-3879 TaxID=2040649 RepID=UPI000E1E8DC3|nr:DNA polymerase III subunit delta' [Helicobacter sp. MIT 14-3879]RDU64848.1 DNA polymerase III subunit delta' [Helicobacter sp. MIT 14-3879]